MICTDGIRSGGSKRTAVRALCLLAATLWVAASAGATPESLQPPGWDSGLALGEAADLNPDPHILEINLDARVAQVQIAADERVDAWTYNGGLPGPLIRLKVGDRLVVHFVNHLPEPTTVHWHGLRIPAAMDGTPGISQPAVNTGESFTYDFVVPDAGLFWYHPHVASAKQVGFGLYGALLVEDPADPVPIADQLVLVLSDIEVDAGGKLAAADTGGTAGMAFGREGNQLLVNGKKTPVLGARSGAPQRWRILNAAKSRYFKLDLGAGNVFTTIGGDGGLMEYPEEHDMLVVAPGERADVIVRPRATPGTGLDVMSQLHNRGYGTVEFRPVDTLFRIAMADLPEVPSAALPAIGRSIAPLNAEGATPVKLELTLNQLPNGTFEYGVNGTPYWRAKPLKASIGETQLWTLNNTTPWSHPFHLHGYFFQVLGKDGKPAHPIQWKDTVDVPFKQTVQVLVRFDDRPGTWMIHCHILDHADGGLMTTVQVGDGPAAEHVHDAR